MNQFTENQHTVSNCYLKTFGSDLWIFDKSSMSWHQKKKSTKKISVLSNYYEHPALPPNDIEIFLSKIENEWSIKGRNKLLSNIKNNNYILTNEDKEIWAKFMWVQSAKVPNSLYDTNKLFSLMSNLINKSGSSELIDCYKSDTFDVKKINLSIIKDVDSEYPKLIDLFYWMILKTSDSMHKFFTSDNPVITISPDLRYKNYIIPEAKKFFVISPDVCIFLVMKHEANDYFKFCENKIKTTNYKSIQSINELHIRNSFKEIYVSTTRQKKFIDSYISTKQSDISKPEIVLKFDKDIYGNEIVRSKREWKRKNLLT
jgi:hypothetical protein